MSESRKVMVTVDGSKQAEYAYQWYLKNIYRDGDIIIVVTVSEYTPSLFLPGAAANYEQICKESAEDQMKIETLLENCVAGLRQTKKAFQTKALHSPKPGAVLLELAEEEKVAMVVMGTRGLGSIRRTLLGSVSSYMLHNCKRPVVVVPVDE